MLGVHGLAKTRNEPRNYLEPLSALTFGSAQFAPSLRTAAEAAAVMSDGDQRALSLARHPSAQPSVRAGA